MLYRIASLVRKELQTLLQDRQGRALLIIPVVLQLVIFSFAATLEVKNNTIGIFNQDAGPDSLELLQRVAQAQAFSRLLEVRSEAELQAVIDEQRALMVLRFPSDFSRKVRSGLPVSIQSIVDGRRSNSGQIALGYVREIVQNWRNDRRAFTSRTPEISEVVIRHWFNPNLDYVRHIIPSLIAIITTISTLVVTSLSVAREREQGTFDQLMVSPLTPGMVMAGKVIPAFFVATFQGTVILTAGVFLFGIPFRGSLPLLYGAMVFYILALAGFGLLISSISTTQQQAFLGVFSFMMPAVLLSGFPSPVENMPVWLQHINWLNPLRHFIVIVKGVFLKDVDPFALLQSLWPLLVIALLTLGSANFMFRKRLG